MAITGISSYDGKQIIAAGAQSAISAGIASNLEYKDGHGTLITTYPGDGQYYSGGFIVGSTVGDKGISISPNMVGFYNSTGDAAQITSGKVTVWDSLSSTKQDKLTFNYNGDSQITGINFSAIAGGGGSVPEGTMVESGLEYNAQNKVTGYSGSAFATIDSECQFFTHDDTLCHLSNSAQYALGVNLSGISADLARMIGVDETILFSGEKYLTALGDIITTESPFNFKKVEIWAISYPSYHETLAASFTTDKTGAFKIPFCSIGINDSVAAIRFNISNMQPTTAGIHITNQMQYSIAGVNQTTTGNSPTIITKIIGIGRKN